MNAAEGFSKEQQAYLQGLVLGNDVARKLKNLPVLSNSATSLTVGPNATSMNSASLNTPSHLSMIHAEAMGRWESQGKLLVAEEKAKRSKDGLGMWSEIRDRGRKGEYPKGTDVFLTKYQGLFYVAPAQNSYMCRMRVPGGLLRSDQIRGLADIADNFAGGYADVTTRANFQLREIASENGISVLMGLRDLGIVAVGAGADNIRNITASPLSGIDPVELIETLPLARELHHYILNQRELYGLPRKFNIAFDGAGKVSALAETNDICFQAVRILPTKESSESVGFLLGLGGITGHGDFARPSHILVKPQDCIALCEAILRVYSMNGDRTDRKKARLKYLLDLWGIDRFLSEVEKVYGQTFNRIEEGAFSIQDHVDRWSHVGVHPQREPNYSYVGVVLPVGRVTSNQLRSLASIASQYGNGEIRLTVWQNLLIPNVANENVTEVQSELEAIGLDWQASRFRAGLVACTGSQGCKYAASDTKRDAMRIAEYLEANLELNEPINIHVTGCHHSCAQHAIADIGLIATKVSVGEEMVEGYNVLIAGKTGYQPQIGRVVFESVVVNEVPRRIAWILERYLEDVGQKDRAWSNFATWASEQEPLALNQAWTLQFGEVPCNTN